VLNVVITDIMLMASTDKLQNVMGSASGKYSGKYVAETAS
jgi:hypothetical protein